MTTKAAIYVRISDDQAGEALGVARQEEDCRTLAAQQGYEVTRVYSDNDMSASKGKHRPDYEAMLTAARAGEFKVILAYSTARLTRRPAEFEELISLHEEHKIKYVTVVSGEDDLSTADGRMIARIKASIDAGEAERTGERVKREKAQSAAAGKPMGARYRTFGYERDWTINEAEAEVVREMFKRFVAGNSINHVFEYMREACNDVNPTTGKHVRYSTVRGMLSNPRYAAINTLNGEVVAKGNWEAIIDDATWAAAEARWEKQPKSKTTNARKHLLSGFLYCGNCNRRLVIGKVKGKDVYRCGLMEGCHKVTFKKEWLDKEILRIVAGHNPFPRPKVVTVDHTPAIAVVEADIQELKDAREAGRIGMGDFLDTLEALNKQRDALVKAMGEQKQQEQAHVGTRYFKDYKALLAADLSEQRVAVARVIDAIIVDRSTRKGRQAAPDWNRVTVAWTAGYEENLGVTYAAEAQREEDSLG